MKWNNNDGKILITELSNLQFNSNTYPGNLYNYNPVLSVSSWFPTEIQQPTPIVLSKEWIIVPSKKYGVCRAPDRTNPAACG